jgi:hypothetical protein
MPRSYRLLDKARAVVVKGGGFKASPSAQVIGVCNSVARDLDPTQTGVEPLRSSRLSSATSSFARSSGSQMRPRSSSWQRSLRRSTCSFSAGTETRELAA